MSEPQRTEEEQRTIRQGELLQREIALVQRINGKYRAIRDEMTRELAKLAREMMLAGVPIERARDEYRSITGDLAVVADWCFTQEYLIERAKLPAGRAGLDYPCPTCGLTGLASPLCHSSARVQWTKET